MSWTNGLRPQLRAPAAALVALFRGAFRITSVRRSRSQQIALWNARANNPYPVAPPGRSLHEHGLAWDMVGDPQLLAQAGAIWNRWGGRWSPRDAIHFEARV